MCCTITEKQNAGNSTNICQNSPTKKNGQLTVNAGGSLYDATCWYDDENNETHDSEQIVNFSAAVKTMCTSHTCSAQGTCQKTPKETRDPKNCSSACSSNADCSSGKLIETRP